MPECRIKLRQEFEKYRHVTDVRVIDMMVIKGRMDLQETVEKWQQPCHMMKPFNESRDPKPKTFLSKFLAGKD